MPPNDEPTPGAGRIAGSNDLQRGMDALTKIISGESKAIQGLTNSLNSLMKGVMGQKTNNISNGWGAKAGQTANDAMEGVRKQQAEQMARREQIKRNQAQDLENMKARYATKSTYATSQQNRWREQQEELAARKNAEGSKMSDSSFNRSNAKYNDQIERSKAQQKQAYEEMRQRMQRRNEQADREISTNDRTKQANDAKLETMKQQSSGAGGFIRQHPVMTGAAVAGGALGMKAAANKVEATGQLDTLANRLTTATGGYSGGSYAKAGGNLLNQYYKDQGYARYGTSTGDRLHAASNLQSNAGSFSNYSKLAKSSAGIGAENPGMSASDITQQQLNLGSNKSSVMGQAFGFGPTQKADGSTMSIDEWIRQFIVKGWGSMDRFNQADITRDLNSQSSPLRISINNAAQMFGIEPEVIVKRLQGMHSYMKKNKAGTKGGKSADQVANQYVKSAQDVTSKDRKTRDAAKKDLKGTGVGESQAQSEKDKSATTADRAVDNFTDMVDVTKELNDNFDKLNGALTGILNIPGIKQIVNSGSAAINNPIGAVGSVIGGVGSAVSGAASWAKRMLGGASGGASGASGSGSSGSSKTDASSKKDTPKASGNKAQGVVDFVTSHVGDAYDMNNRMGPHTFDCSSLAARAYASVGVSIPALSGAQWDSGNPVDPKDVQAGDLLFPKGEDGMWGAAPGKPGHVMVAISGNTLVEAANPSVGVIKRGFSASELKGARRYVDGGTTSGKTQDGSDNKDGKDQSGGSSAMNAGAGGAYGSIQEKDALMAAFGGGGAGGGGGSTGSKQSDDNSGGNSQSDSGGDTASGTLADAGSLSTKQQGYAKSIIGAANSLGMGKVGAADAISCALVESNLTMFANSKVAESLKLPHDQVGHDGMSVGLFQQQIGFGWGDVATCMDPAASAKTFLSRLKKISGWEKGPNGENVADVQRPAEQYRGRYQDMMPTAKKIVGYAKGAWEIPEDQNATIHKGEMVVPQQQAQQIRAALMQGISKSVDPAGGGHGGGGQIVFSDGSIRITVSGGAGGLDTSSARRAAKEIVDTIAADARIKKLKVGL